MNKTDHELITVKVVDSTRGFITLLKHFCVCLKFSMPPPKKKFNGGKRDVLTNKTDLCLSGPTMDL